MRLWPPVNTWSVVPTADGRCALTATAHGRLQLRLLEDGRLLKDVETQAGTIRTAVFGPHERFVITRSWEGTVQVFDLADGRCVRDLTADRDPVPPGRPVVLDPLGPPSTWPDVTVSADGVWVLVAGNPATLWELDYALEAPAASAPPATEASLAE